MWDPHARGFTNERSCAVAPRVAVLCRLWLFGPLAPATQSSGPLRQLAWRFSPGGAASSPEGLARAPPDWRTPAVNLDGWALRRGYRRSHREGRPSRRARFLVARAAVGPHSCQRRCTESWPEATIRRASCTAAPAVAYSRCYLSHMFFLLRKRGRAIITHARPRRAPTMVPQRRPPHSGRRATPTTRAVATSRRVQGPALQRIRLRRRQPADGAIREQGDILPPDTQASPLCPRTNSRPRTPGTSPKAEQPGQKPSSRCNLPLANMYNTRSSIVHVRLDSSWGSL